MYPLQVAAHSPFNTGHRLTPVIVMYTFCAISGSPVNERTG